jgi:hypothetical protein
MTPPPPSPPLTPGAFCVYVILAIREIDIAKWYIAY